MNRWEYFRERKAPFATTSFKKGRLISRVGLFQEMKYLVYMYTIYKCLCYARNRKSTRGKLRQTSFVVQFEYSSIVLSKPRASIWVTHLACSYALLQGIYNVKAQELYVCGFVVEGSLPNYTVLYWSLVVLWPWLPPLPSPVWSLVMLHSWLLQTTYFISKCMRREALQNHCRHTSAELD